jgi:hypothetical protein
MTSRIRSAQASACATDVHAHAEACALRVPAAVLVFVARRLQPARPTVIAAAIALAVTLPAAVAAQQRPSFAGTWKYVSSTPPNYPGSNGWGVPSPTVVVTQTGTELTIESGQFGATSMRVVYKLDGTDTVWDGTSSSQSGSTAVVKWRTKASWDGNRLVLYTWNTALNQMRDIMSLSGGQLTIVRATEQPGPSTNATLTYTKGS